MIEILLNIIFSPEFILLGTFFRTSPISGTNSGKLKFANLVTNAILTEGEKGITISTFFNQAINFRELAFGQGTGITSSEFFRFDPTSFGNRPRLFGPGQITGHANWSSTHNLNWGIYKHSFLIGGCYNCIGNGVITGPFSCYDLIINGKCNYILGAGPESGAKYSTTFNTILTGYKSNISSGSFNSLISSRSYFNYGTPDGYTGCDNHNVSINSMITGRGNSKHNTIISFMPKFCYAGMNQLPSFDNDRLKGVYYSSIISSVGDYVTLNYRTNGGGTIKSKETKFSSIISSFDSSILNSDPGSSLTHSSYNTILASSCSKIFNDKSYTPVCGNSIISNCYSCIVDSDSSSIIGGFKNIIDGNPNSILLQRRLRSSTIIGGVYNKIFSQMEGYTTTPSAIIGGYKNCISLQYNSNYHGGSAILGGCENIAKFNSVIISSGNSCVFGSDSAIISSCQSFPVGKASAVISSCLTPVSNSNYTTIISSSKVCYNTSASFCSTIISSSRTNLCGATSPNTVLSSYRGYFCENAGLNLSFLSAIVSATLPVIKDTYNSIISGQGFTRTYFNKSSTNFSSGGSKLCCTTNSGVISSINSYICCSCNSFIISGSNNTIFWSSGVVCNSVILGACQKGLTLSNTVMTQHFNFACSCIFSTNTSTYRTGIVGTFSNCFYCTLKIVNGFITN